ncbi:MAG: HAMP domain-containing protein [Limnohabitans sp.]
MKAISFGRFEQSFMFHMIRDFFLLLIVVAGLELGIRYAVVVYDFKNNEPQLVERAAHQLADDVKSIMLNSGGPTAARTVYPIMNRNYDDLGLSIAVVPSDITIESIKQTFKLDPMGLKQQWPEGDNAESTVQLKAEQFCLTCHVKAKVGDVLGTVFVRSYFSRKETNWWHEVRVTASALSIKIVIHTIVLFILLQVRMEPLLALRATAASLAKGVMNLSPRTKVNSNDEFGELAQDFNHFLDRVKQIVQDLDGILSEVVSVGSRLGVLNRHLEQQLDGMRDDTFQNSWNESQRNLSMQIAAARESGAFEVLVQTLDELSHSSQHINELAPLRAQLAKLQNSFLSITNAVKDASPSPELPKTQAAQYQALSQSLREMALLEASMQKVAEAGQQVIHRLAQDKVDS